MPKSASGPPGLWLAVRMIAPDFFGTKAMINNRILSRKREHRSRWDQRRDASGQCTRRPESKEYRSGPRRAWRSRQEFGSESRRLTNAQTHPVAGGDPSYDLDGFVEEEATVSANDDRGATTSVLRDRIKDRLDKVLGVAGLLEHLDALAQARGACKRPQWVSKTPDLYIGQSIKADTGLLALERTGGNVDGLHCNNPGERFSSLLIQFGTIVGRDDGGRVGRRSAADPRARVRGIAEFSHGRRRDH